MDCLPAEAPDDEPLPSLEALVAGTVALMTAWADPCPQASLAPMALRGVLARKVVSNLFLLQHHPLASPQLRQVFGQAHQRWVGLAQAGLPDRTEPVTTSSPRLH